MPDDANVSKRRPTGKSRGFACAYDGCSSFGMGEYVCSLCDRYFHYQCVNLAGCTRCEDNLDTVICNVCRPRLGADAVNSAGADAGAVAGAAAGGERMQDPPHVSASASGDTLLGFPSGGVGVAAAAEVVMPAPHDMRSLQNNLASLFKSGTDELRASISSLKD